MIAKLILTGLLVLPYVVMINPVMEVWNMEVWSDTVGGLIVMAAWGLCALFALSVWTLTRVWK